MLRVTLGFLTPSHPLFENVTLSHYPLRPCNIIMLRMLPSCEKPLWWRFNVCQTVSFLTLRVWCVTEAIKRNPALQWKPGHCRSLRAAGKKTQTKESANYVFVRRFNSRKLSIQLFAAWVDMSDARWYDSTDYATNEIRWSGLVRVGLEVAWCALAWKWPGARWPGSGLVRVGLEDEFNDAFFPPLSTLVQLAPDAQSVPRDTNCASILLQESVLIVGLPTN